VEDIDDTLARLWRARRRAGGWTGAVWGAVPPLVRPRPWGILIGLAEQLG